MKRLFICSLIVAAASCGGGGAASDMELANNGYVKISGGCECYTEGLITFRPRGNAVEVDVDNSGAWFYKGNVQHKSFKMELAADEAAEFFGDLKAILDNPRSTETFSTRAAVIEIYLPLRDGTVETTWRELDMKQDVNPLVDLLQEFVEECGEEA